MTAPPPPAPDPLEHLTCEVICHSPQQEPHRPWLVAVSSPRTMLVNDHGTVDLTLVRGWIQVPDLATAQELGRRLLNGAPVPEPAAPQHIEPPEEFTQLWPTDLGGHRRMDEAWIKENIGTSIELSYTIPGRGRFSYQAEILSVTLLPDHATAQVTLRRLTDEKHDPA